MRNPEVTHAELDPRHRKPSQDVAVGAVAGRREFSVGRGWRYYRDLVVHLVGSQLASRYRRSVLGWLWAVAYPLAQLAVFYFVFTDVLATAREHFLLFLFAGIIAWTWFSAALSTAATSLVGRRDLVLRPGFPTILLPVVAVLVTLVDYLLALPLLLIGAILSVGADRSYVLLPILIVVQFAFTAGLALVVAPLNVFFRDVGHLLGIALMLLFFMTPVFYSAEQAPDRVSFLYKYNPLAQLIDAYRTILIERALPAPLSLGLTAAAALVFLLIGLGVFIMLRPYVPDRL